MIRSHETVVADGTFRVVLTPKMRLVAVIDAPRTMLGPMHIALDVDRGIHPDVLRRHALAERGLHPRYMQIGGIFGDIGNFISKAAEGAFNTVSKAVTTIARPVFDVTKHAVSFAMQGIAKVTPFLPSKVRNQISSAARVVARARLGDLTAKQFVRTIAQAAKAGVAGAMKIGDALLDGAKLVGRVIDLPVQLLQRVPGVGDIVKSLSPFQKFDKMASAIQRGDLKALKQMITDDLHTFQGVASLIPGIGTGISAGISAGLAALDGGSPIEIAVNAAYGAIPIPIGIRHVTDAVLASVIELAKGGNVTDVAVAAAREKVPSGLPRDVFDTLVRILVKRVPIQRAAGALASHYVNQYAGKAGSQLLGQAERIFDPKLAEMARRALPIGGAPLRVIRPIFRPITVAGEGPIAGYEVAGEGLLAGYDVAGEDPPGYAVAGEGPIAGYDVAGEESELFVAGEDSDLFVGAEISRDLLARLPAPHEWRSMRAAAG